MKQTPRRHCHGAGAAFVPYYDASDACNLWWPHQIANHKFPSPASDALTRCPSPAGAVAIRSGKALQGIRDACLIGRLVLDRAARAVAPGVTTDEIDAVVHAACLELGAYPSPYNYYNFPKSVCTSINEIICHGIPDRRPPQDGDIVNIDVSVFYKGWHGDLNETVVVGDHADEASKQLVKVTHDVSERAPSTSLGQLSESERWLVSKQPQ